MSSFVEGKKISGKMKTMGGDHNKFLNRITKSLYYSKLPMTDRLSLPVTEFAAELFSEVKSGCSLERLDVHEASRISRNACVSPCSFVLALLYLERLKDCNPEYLYKVSPSELFLVSLMVASKFLNDDGEEDEVFNAEWASSGDLTLAHMNRLEKEFLNAINWAIYVYDEDFWERLKKLEEHMAYKEATKRGWFSYTELSCLMKVIDLSAILQAIFSISSICLLTYTAGILTLIGSTIITSHIPGTSLAKSKQSIQLENNTTDTQFIEPINSMENNSEYLLVYDNIQNNLSCDVYCDNCEKSTSQIDSTTGWHWLLKPLVAAWFLTKHTTSNNHDKIQFDLHRNDRPPILTKYITNSRTLLFNHHFVWEDITLQLTNWREAFLLNLEYPQKNWKHYVDYITKISLRQQH